LFSVFSHELFVTGDIYAINLVIRNVALHLEPDSTRDTDLERHREQRGDS
jgi:hypothetical protein